MRFGKVIAIAFTIFFAFSSVEIYAQDKKSPQKILLSKDKFSSFKEGETVIAEVKFTGLDSNCEDYDGNFEKSVYESDFLKLLRESRATISAEEKFNPRKIEKVIRLLKEWLAAEGYLKAGVVALGEELPKNQMNLVFSVKRNAMIHVSEIRFVGNKNIAGEEFAADFKECSGERWERFDKRRYDYYSQMCSLRLMFSKGYFQAKVKRVSPRVVDDNYVVTIEVEEGTRFLIGEIKFSGAKAFTEKELLEMCGQKTGDVADGKLLQSFVYEKLKKHYARKGFVLYNTEFEPKFIKPQIEGLDGIVNIQITIDEGKAFRLAKIDFTGVESSKTADLRKFLTIKDGEIFNQEEFEKGIEQINETKGFYLVDIDRDVEMRTDEENSEILITIKLTEIK